jgi:hypothetical protein
VQNEAGAKSTKLSESKCSICLIHRFWAKVVKALCLKTP